METDSKYDKEIDEAEQGWITPNPNCPEIPPHKPFTKKQRSVIVEMIKALEGQDDITETPEKWRADAHYFTTTLRMLLTAQRVVRRMRAKES
jgi:hypothetical protein